MSPLGKGVSVSPYVGKVLDIIDRSGLDYELHSMGTIIEGPWAEVMDMITECHMLLEKECDRISTVMKIDYRKGVSNGINNKIKSVEEHVGRALRTGRSK